jgi:hypothetical protein
VCFPNSLPRFCGQTFAESADKNWPCCACRHTTIG